MRIIKITIIPLLFIIPAALSAIDFKVRVYDRVKGLPVSDAQVIIIEARKKYITNDNGIARATVQKKGFYTFRIITPDGIYRELRFRIRSRGQTVEVLIGKGAITPKKKKVITGGGGIEVTGRKEKTRLSRYNIRIEEVKRLPGFFGEAMRGLETLPGINTPHTYGANNLIIRGANPNANFYLVDDLPIGYVYHMIGLDSVLHNDFMKSIDVYTGAYPVEFGDATGGIIAIETADEVKKFGGHVTFSLWSTNILFKAPFTDKSGYWIAAARGSYLDQTLKPYIPDGFRVPRYGDGQLKIHYRFNPKHSITFYAFGAKDTMGITVDDRPAWDPTTEPDPIVIGANINVDVASHTEAIRYEWRPTSRIVNTATIYNFDFLFYIDGSIGEISAKEKIQDGNVAFKDIFSWEIMKNHIFFDIGVEARVNRYRNDGTTIRQLNPDDADPDPYDTEDPDFITVPVKDRHFTSYHSGYVMLTAKGKGFECKPGVRVDYFGLTKHRVIDPRGTFSYTFKTKTTLIGGAGVYHRNPDAYEYSPSSGNPYLKMERAEHYGAGIEQIWHAWTFKIEVFRHYFTDIVVADPYITTPYRENRDPYDKYEEPYLYNDRLGYSNDGTGFSEGYEVYIKKSNPPGKIGWYGWISYSWTRAIRNDHQHVPTDEEKDTIYSADGRRIAFQYDNTKDQYSNNDRKHIINVVFGYKITRKYQVGIRWHYMSSSPHTPIINSDDGTKRAHNRVIFDPEFSKLENSARLKPYHRLDFRIDRFINYGWGFGNVFLEILNVYMRNNPEGLQYSRSLPYSASNPTIQDAFGNLAIPYKSKYYRIPLFNFGIEVQF